MKNYISYFQWGGPFNAISTGNVKIPSSGKQALKDISTVGKAFLLPFAALQSCSGKYCNAPDDTGIKELDAMMSQGPVKGAKIRNYYLDEYTLPIEVKDRLYNKKTNTYKNDTIYDEYGQMRIDYAPGTIYEGEDNDVKGTAIGSQSQIYGHTFTRFPSISLYYNNNNLGPDSTKTVNFNLRTAADAEKLGIDPYLWDAPSGTQKKNDVSKSMTHTQFVNTFKK